MNRTPTTSDTTTAKSTTQAVFNYAEAAKRSSQIQDQQQSPQRSSTTQSPSNTTSASGNNDSNKKGNNNNNNNTNGNVSFNGTNASSTQSTVNSQQQQPSFASTLANSTTATNSSPPNKSASPATKNARNASVQLPRAPPTDAAPIQFGSINQGTDLPAQSTSNKNGEAAPVLKSSEVTFGSLPATDASSGTTTTTTTTTNTTAQSLSSSQPHHPPHHNQQRRDSTHSNHSEQGSSSPAHFNNNSNNNNNNNNSNTRHYRHHYNNQNKHQGMPHSPNMQNSQPFVPHHQKKPISPHMQSAPSPNVAGQNMPMPHSWGSPGPVHHQPGPYFVPQNFENQRHYYPPYQGMGYVGHGGNNPASQPYVPPQRNNKAIRIINPETMTEVKAEAVASTSSSTANSSKDSSSKSEERSSTSIKKEELKPTSSNTSTPTPSPATPASSSSTSTPAGSNSTTAAASNTSSSSKAIPIIDPAIKDRQAREKREREEAAQTAKEEEERKAKEEAERKEREEKERLEAERKAKEEAERKEREEKERLEAEQKAKEEAERKEREEKERLEAEQKAKEEAERKAKEEAEQKAKEDEEKKKKAEEAAAAAAAAAKASEEEEAEKKKKAENAPGRLDMAAVSKTSSVTGNITATPTSVTPARATAPKTPAGPMRTIEDPSTIQYPPTVKAPFGSKDPSSGKITYEPDFLLQFAPLCLETSEDLSQFQNMSEEQNDRGPRSMSRRQTSERGRGGPRTPSSPMDMHMFRHGSRDGRMEMGKFAGGRPLSHRAGSGSHALPPAGGPGSPGGMQREGSHGGRSRSGRGGKNRHGNKGGNSGDNQEKQERQQQGAPTIPPEQVKPLEQSQNRWVPLALRKQREAEKAENELMSDEVIIRKVKSLLNKLTLEKFDSISDQIWEYAKQSEKETDGRALKVVIQLTFDKACDEPPFAVMWAQLCRKMYDTITDEIKDVNVKDKEGNTVSGVNLLRKYLLNRCQHDFERGWKMQIPEVDQNNPDMMSDEYYAAVKAKRQGLGLVVFIGELFKRQMLTDRIMLQCLTRLCDNPREVGDEETETMCKLITTIGKSLDTSSRRNKEWMDTYFERMKEMMESPHLSSRVKFMILDLFDLRKNKWVSRRGNQPAPTTIAQVHEQAQKAKNEEKEAMKRTSSSRGSLPHPMSRAGSHRGAGSRDLQREGSTGSNAASTTVDGWSTVGSGSPGSSSKGTRANELANFGKTDRSKTRSSVLGPGNSPFASLHRASSKAGGDQKSSPSESRSSSANMFSALGGEGADDGHNENHHEEKSEDKQEDHKQEEKQDDSEAATTSTTTITPAPATTTTTDSGSTPQED